MKFYYQNPFPVSEDKTDYHLLTEDYIESSEFDGKEIIKVLPDGLKLLATQAMKDVSFLLRPQHQELVGRILRDPEASINDKTVARTMLKNAVISAERKLPFCQDTGTAIIFAKKGQQIWTDGNDTEALSEGIFKTYQDEYLRYSQLVPLSMYDEKNSGNNLPAQIDILAVPGDEYMFLFIAKGGGSANTFSLFQMTKSVLNPISLKKIPYRKNENTRDCRMPSLSSSDCHWRDIR